MSPDGALLEIGYMGRRPARGGRFRRHTQGPGGEVRITAMASCNRTLEIKSLEAMRSCPQDCGFMAELGTACTFQCVTGDQCGEGETNPYATIPDAKEGRCRQCSVPGCEKCNIYELDKCLPDGCAPGYMYEPVYGRCASLGGPVFITIKVVLALILAYVLIWYFDLLVLRPAVNQKGVEEGLRYREATKLKMPIADGSEGQELYPLTTNLSSVSNAGVAGAGAVLHFNFQVVLIVWSLVLALVWYVVAEVKEPQLLQMGLKPAATPAMHCAVIHWGHNLQANAMWVKVGFLVFAYVFSFLGTVIYAAVQLKRFCMMDDITTMKDFVLIVRGLPVMKGDNPAVEEETKAFLEEKTGQKILGVSVGWYFYDKAEQVTKAVDDEILELEEAWSQHGELPHGDGGSGGTPSEEDPSRGKPNVVRRALLKMDDLLFLAVGGGEEPVPAEEEDEDEKVDGRAKVESLLHNVDSSGIAFVVFNTEDERDHALEACRAVGGYEVHGKPKARVTFHEEDMEPNTVAFHHLGISRSQFWTNILWGLLTVAIAQVLWIVCFFLPYAYYVVAFSYAHGDEPDWSARFLFSMIVVIGNQIMYQVCAYVANTAGFEFTDTSMAYYTVLYTATCFINIVVDLWITAILSYRLMVALGARMVDGRLLSESTSLHDLYEEYAMQRALGYQTWSYNFPSTFLIPFVIEFLFVVVLIRHLMILIVGSHGEMNMRRSEQALAVFLPMDLGRYADLILNVLLSTVSFFFPPGFFLRTFIALACCHLWVLMYDHYRVLRCVPAFNYSSDVVERMAQAVLGVPCGMILVAIVVKGNCMNSHLKEPSGMCVRDRSLVLRMAGAFIVHMIVYLLVHRIGVSLLEKRFTHTQASDDFATVAARTPCSWFNANPVHCLRSKYIHKHSPPCMVHVTGKEHLLKANPEIHSHFERSPASRARQ